MPKYTRGVSKGNKDVTKLSNKKKSRSCSLGANELLQSPLETVNRTNIDSQYEAASESDGDINQGLNGDLNKSRSRKCKLSPQRENDVDTFSVNRCRSRSRSRSKSQTREEGFEKDVNMQQFIERQRQALGDEVIVSVPPSEDDFGCSDEEEDRGECQDSRALEDQVYDGNGSDSEIQFTGDGKSKSDKFQSLKDDPEFQKYLDQAVAEKLDKERTILIQQIKGNEGNDENANGNANVTPYKMSKRVAQPILNSNVVKSPSDTTIYAPGLNKNVSPGTLNRLQSNKLGRLANIDKISEFVAQIRLESGQKDSEMKEPQPGTSRGGDSVDRARKIAEKMIVDAEQFRAEIGEA